MAKPHAPAKLPLLHLVALCWLLALVGPLACVAPLRQQHGLLVRPYIVQRGDTLSSIARRFASWPQALASVNGLQDPRRLQVGQALRIPAPRPRSSKVAGRRRGNRPAAAGSFAQAQKAAAAPPIGASGAAAAPLPQLAAREYGLIWPAQGVITSPFGKRHGNAHDGIDIGAPQGAPVRAAATGQVMFAQRHGDYGNVVIVRHPGGVVTVYAHHAANCVAVGQSVVRGQTIARVGATGNATGPHLHFEVRRYTRPQDPMAFLPRLPATKKRTG